MLCVGFFLFSYAPAHAAEVTVAVASNFSVPMRKIVQNFEIESGHKVRLSFGSTGGFYAQIKNGGPFQILVAADRETPSKLEKEALGVPGSSFTYAMGKLVLWSRKPNLVDQQGQILKVGQFQKLAIANPKLAPYGAAAMETLNKLGLLNELLSKLVQGENINQAFQYVETENAQIGFVAMSQIVDQGKLIQGSAWVVPAHLYAPIQQDAILLLSGQGNAAALALMVYLKSPQAKSIMTDYGYTH
jgi:molybdate transport system substrate-binding protein